MVISFNRLTTLSPPNSPFRKRFVNVSLFFLNLKNPPNGGQYTSVVFINYQENGKNEGHGIGTGNIISNERTSKHCNFAIVQPIQEKIQESMICVD